MMCSKCGAQIQEGAKFCGACGTPLIVLTSSAVQIEEGVSTATIPERSARPRLWQNRTTAFLVAAVVVFGFTLLIVLTTRNRRTLMLPELESLFRQSRSCPLIKEWVVDFAGGGRPYLLELRHCSSAQMSKFNCRSTSKSINGLAGRDPSSKLTITETTITLLYLENLCLELS